MGNLYIRLADKQSGVLTSLMQLEIVVQEAELLANSHAIGKHNR